MHCDDSDVQCILYSPTKASVGRHEKIQRVEIKTDILLLHQQSYNRIYYILLCGFSMCVPILPTHIGTRG